MDKMNKEKVVRKFCPYKFRHFCDGKPNLSVYDNKEEAVAKPPCRLRHNCPVRYQIRRAEEEYGK